MKSMTEATIERDNAIDEMHTVTGEFSILDIIKACQAGAQAKSMVPLSKQNVDDICDAIVRENEALKVKWNDDYLHSTIGWVQMLQYPHDDWDEVIDKAMSSLGAFLKFIGAI
jgi:hypothetical protein